MGPCKRRLHLLLAPCLLLTACPDDSGDGAATDGGSSGSSGDPTGASTADPSAGTTGTPQTTGETTGDGSTSGEETTAGGETTTGGPELGSLGIVVVAPPTSQYDAPEQPLVGAMVALDFPDAERVELLTDEDGRVVFEDIDWSKGSVMATAYRDGHTVRSELGLTPAYLETVPGGAITEDGDLRMRLQPTDAPPEQVVISGAAQNMDDQGNTLLVTPTVAGGWSQATGPDWEFPIASGTPFTLVGLEFFLPPDSTVSDRGTEQTFVKWGRLDHEGVTKATSDVLIDLDSPLEPQSVSGTFAIPDHGISDFFDTCRGYGGLTSWDSSGAAGLGFPSRIDVSDDGAQFEFEFEFVALDEVSDPLWQVYMHRGSALSRVNIPGLPQDGPVEVVFPEPAVFSPPSNIGETFQWQLNAVDLADEELQPFVVLFASSIAGSKATTWFVGMPPGTTSVTLPELPSAAEPGTIDAPNTVSAQIYTCENSSPDYECERYAVSAGTEVLQ